MPESYHFRNLVFEGGGVKGIAYVGALDELDKRQILPNIRRIAGTSAGAVNAVLLATGHTAAETTRILLDLDFRNFLDESWGLLRDGKRLLDEFGWYKGDFFRDWIGERIAVKTGNEGSTFSDFSTLGLAELYLVATNLSTGFSEVMSAEHTPRMTVAEAARRSMSIPLFFRAVRGKRGQLLVDGGVLRNYPVKVFDRSRYVTPGRRRLHARTTSYYREDNRNRPAGSCRYVYNKETLGFRLDSLDEIALFRDGALPTALRIGDFFDYGWALFQTVLNSQNNSHLHSDDWQRTIYIDTLGVGSTDFELSATKKKRLIASGAEGVRAYFDWYDNARAAELPCNHPQFR